jgi:hypothetical protein
VAAAVGTFGADVATHEADVLRAKLEAFEEDPMRVAGKAARKWGLVTLGAGIASLVLSVVSKTIDQSYLNDITNTIGLPQQSPPTVGSPAAPAPPTAPPPTPPQVGYMNAMIEDINALDTASAAGNVALLQDALKQLWGIANFVYGVTPTGPTQSPITGSNPTGGATGLGPQLSIAIVECCALIYGLEGKPTNAAEWAGTYWTDIGVFDGGQPNKFLTGITAEASGGFMAVGPADWTLVQTELSSVENSQNFKQTINGLAFYLNQTQPWDLSQPGNGNYWGVLGTVAQDLSAIGSAVAGAAEVAVNDVEVFGKDVSQFAGDIGQALGFMAKVLLNLPRLGFDSLGFAFWWGVDMLTSAIWVPLVITGSCLMVFSVFALNVYPRIETRLKLAVKARTAGTWARFDRRWHSLRKAKAIRADTAKEEILEASVAPVDVLPPTVQAPAPLQVAPAAEVSSTKAEEVAGAVPTAPSLAEPAPAPSPVEPTPTETTEAILGGVEPVPEVPKVEPTSENPPAAVSEPRPEPTSAELEVQEANRQETLPEPGPSYRERKRESQRKKADRMLAQMNEAFA